MEPEDGDMPKWPIGVLGAAQMGACETRELLIFRFSAEVPFGTRWPLWISNFGTLVF